MAFASSSLGLVATDAGDILRTTDGGITWEDVPSINGCFSDVAFANTTLALATSCAGDIYRSADAGLTWQYVNAAVGEPLQVAFADADTAIAVGANVIGGPGIALRSSDGGASWQPITISAPNGRYSGVWFASPTEGFICGPEQVLHTLDGGVTWATEMAYRGGVFSTGQRLPDGTSIMVGGNGVVMKRSN